MIEKVESGRANHLGFAIKSRGIEVFSKDCLNSCEALVSKTRSIIAALIIIGIFLIHILIARGQVTELGLLFRCLLLALICSFAFSLMLSRFVDYFILSSRRQWHSCENKVINLFRRNLEPTLENLRKMSITSPTCGTQDEFIIMTTFLNAYLLLMFTKVHVFLILLTLAAVGWFLLLLAFMGVVFPTQYLSLKKPTEEQLREALRVAKEFKTKLEERGEWR